MATKNEVVRIRLSAEEKARWVEAAGGPRRLSDWIRSLANAAAENEPLLHEPVVEATQQALVPPAPVVPPVERLDAIGVPESGTGKVSIGKGNGVEPRCLREHHHRPGVYCAACHRTPIKPQKRA